MQTRAAGIFTVVGNFIIVQTSDNYDGSKRCVSKAPRKHEQCTPLYQHNEEKK